MRISIPLLVILLLVFSYPLSAGFEQATKSEKITLNPKQVSEATFRIVQSGTLIPSGQVTSMNLTIHMPQEGVLNISVTAGSWKYSADEFGNKLLVLEWKNPSGAVTYAADITVKNTAKYPTEKAVGSDPEYLRENDQIRFTPDIAKAAFPFEKTLKKAAELAEWVNEYVTYDLSMVSQLKPSDWVYENRRGVCVEYANLLSSMLKMSGIPTRYIVGYAYSAVESKLIGHTWVEVLASDGSWIPLDPTWLQAGYLDATHIKTANRLDANTSEKLAYTGFGNIDVSWKKNDDEITLLDYKLGNVTSISLSADNITFNENGIIKGVVKPNSCTIENINVSSCTTSSGSPLLNIEEPERKLWACGSTEVYWAFNAISLERGFSYTCPVSAYDQTGSSAKTDVSIKGTRTVSSATITGPETAGVNEPFALEAVTDGEFTFFSPELGKSSGKQWVLKLSKGQYSFYLVSAGALSKKTVNVVEKREFSVSAAAPKNVTENGTFILSVSVENLANEKRNAIVRVDFEATLEKQIVLEPLGKSGVDFNLTAAKAGTRKISAAAIGNGIYSYSTSIVVLPKQKAASPVDSAVDSLTDVIVSFFKAILNFFIGLFPR